MAGRIDDKHLEQLLHNWIIPISAAYGSGGEVVLELVDEMQRRMAEFMEFVADTLGVGFISLVVHLLTHGPEICREVRVGWGGGMVF